MADGKIMAEVRIMADPKFISYLRHIFEYIGTQFPPPSSVLYGKMGSITLFFSNGNIKYDTTFYA